LPHLDAIRLKIQIVLRLQCQSHLFGFRHRPERIHHFPADIGEGAHLQDQGLTLGGDARQIDDVVDNLKEPFRLGFDGEEAFLEIFWRTLSIP
jgi:hypothetical protein